MPFKKIVVKMAEPNNSLIMDKVLSRYQSPEEKESVKQVLNVLTLYEDHPIKVFI